MNDIGIDGRALHSTVAWAPPADNSGITGRDFLVLNTLDLVAIGARAFPYLGRMSAAYAVAIVAYCERDMPDRHGISDISGATGIEPRWVGRVVRVLIDAGELSFDNLSERADGHVRRLRESGPCCFSVYEVVGGC